MHTYDVEPYDLASSAIVLSIDLTFSPWPTAVEVGAELPGAACSPHRGHHLPPTTKGRGYRRPLPP